jgi:hypothetical protein
MTKWRAATVILAVADRVCVEVAIYYWATPAGSLPGFFPAKSPRRASGASPAPTLR